MGNGTSNETDYCSDPMPYAYQYFEDISDVELAMVLASAFLTLMICMMFVENLWYLQKNYKSQKTKIFSVWQIGLHPVIAITSLLTIVIPRSFVMNKLVSSVYMSVSIHIFMRLIIHYHGGEDSMVNTMANDRIPLRSPPLACCICCCPKVKVTRTNLRRIELLVHQVVFLRPLLKFLAAVLWTDGEYSQGQIDPSKAYLYVAILNAVSALVATYGLILLYRASKKHLQKFNLLPKYLNLKIVIIVTSVQQFVFTSLSHFNIPACIGHNTSITRGYAFNNMLLIAEMFLLVLPSRCCYRTPETTITVAHEISVDKPTKGCTSEHTVELPADRDTPCSTGSFRD